ncbi:MAG: hypothetical protein O6945_00900 [Gammaproteobacteria bacterium]|nr:hypothetical protein [Gammaproteobacteria bacterium]
MMTDDRDPLLQTLFAEAQRELDGEAFTAHVMARTRSQRYQVIAGWFGVALVLAACTWLLALPIQEFAQLIVQGLAITLIDLGDSWLAWLFSPVNNIAGLLVLSVKAIRIIRKKIIGASYAN